MTALYFSYLLRLPLLFNRWLLWGGVLSALLCLQHAPVSAAPLPYNENSWDQIKKTYEGKRHIVHFWGVTCGPCLEELKTWAQFVRQHPAIPLTLVQVDEVTPDQAEKLLQKTGMDKVENWSLAAYLSDAMRYEIDPGWFGDLPYTRLTGNDGRTQTLRGVADFAGIEQWLREDGGDAVASQGKSGRK
jgi:thiol-disulfide isomerase/thioredoxin